ncbi:Spore protein SP21 [Gemmata obscuriglobus]|uniref:Hsp20/alpha crystallin family protein n=1 Tax=Gemmata obscuriglobus TaxID=114 RepID=A0A2Z3H2Q4_9BACT|nr:Hsp20/alpha crystallin family protein [Gemmata obscuriglobus]AWM37405.1 Hsp20/alpha crystallin family protein [Gemmata obscuriglobus]QEG29836.1 Spore protein SP21 [Gemmata obscuriglobus]VTS09153.1 Heat shock protein Hsp20 OS=Rhodopirellula maiorica SM1 GN=RMSM_05793 PE=3 SV=1: HSP20 [Gemmata obscuriglobus UQM 2246]
MSNLVQTPAAPAATESSRAATVSPRVDILETEHEFLVLADAPGLNPDDVDIRFEQGEMTIHGRRQTSRDTAPIAYHRSFAVADTIAADRISAELKDGVLTVKLPKTEAIKPRRIAVRG